MKKQTPTVFWMAIVVTYLVLFFLEYFWLSAYSEEIYEMKWNWGWAIFYAQTLYTILSFKIVGPTELGAILLFGKPIKEVGSGLVFVPLGICGLEKETRLVIQEEFPADPEKIFRGEEKTPEGMFPPIRIPFADEPGEDDPLSKRITAEIVPIVRYKINDYILFLTRIGSRKEAKRQMEDATVALCMRELTKISASTALKTLQGLNQTMKSNIDTMVDGWGIDVETAQIKTINFHHDLNIAISSLPEARFKAKAAIEEAEGEKRKRTLEGEGSGSAEKSVLEGRTAGLKEMANELGLNPQMVLNAETARAITENPGQKTIVVGAGGLKEIIGMAATIGQTVVPEKEDTK